MHRPLAIWRFGIPTIIFNNHLPLISLRTMHGKTKKSFKGLQKKEEDEDKLSTKKILLSFFFWKMKILLLINELSFCVIFTKDKCPYNLKHSWHDMACKTIINETQNNFLKIVDQSCKCLPKHGHICTSAHTVQLNYAISYKLRSIENADSKMHFSKYVIIQQVVFLSSCPDRSMCIYIW